MDAAIAALSHVDLAAGIAIGAIWSSVLFALFIVRRLP